ncbi:MAG: hypothetical protein GQ469_05120 [Methanosarcinales archaeon]|jgi:hypothetical protein|nr:MAG: hypothetical protein C5S44_06975 [ANME-2 cluster archaeon]KAF5423822.1 MAG: hypothetical protein C5S45_00365 [ANME-2 cluster archaeon]NOR59994.1 hypothetical protein [Methanosarcinales archaeon]
MGINSATVIEFLNMCMGICIVVISFYAYKKFSLRIFRRGWLIVALSGVVMVLGSILREYYSYANLYTEWAWLGRLFILIHLVLLVIGIYLMAVTAVKMWGD